jgi:hypothetical protein
LADKHTQRFFIWNILPTEQAVAEETLRCYSYFYSNLMQRRLFAQQQPSLTKSYRTLVCLEVAIDIIRLSTKGG